MESASAKFHSLHSGPVAKRGQLPISAKLEASRPYGVSSKKHLPSGSLHCQVESVARLAATRAVRAKDTQQSHAGYKQQAQQKTRMNQLDAASNRHPAEVAHSSNSHVVLPKSGTD